MFIKETRILRVSFFYYPVYSSFIKNNKMNYCILSAFIILPFAASSQQQVSSTNQQLISNYGYGTMIEMKDVNGRPLIHKKYDIDIKGTPFILEDWCDTDLKLTNGNEYHNAKIKLNVESNELNYLDSLNQNIVLNKGIIKELRFNQKMLTATNTLIFRNSYPPIDKQDTSHFYQVLADGKITFLKFVRKKISVLKNDLTGEVEKEFTEYIEYYIYFNNEIKPLKKNQQFFFDMMSDKIKAVEKFTDTGNTSFKNIESIKKLVAYYNSLM